ncbi:MAG TPA: LURP-one-related family protein [Verrucomicrobiae bacterium]|nr:LURP-one-related family protein [Verrucomicrobiae bacterium]
MQYVMQEKWLCLGEDFSIKDREGRELYYIDGRALSLGKKLSFQNTERREIAFIRQRLLSWGPNYEILRDDHILATVKKKLLTLFHCKFSVDLAGPNDLEAKGNFLDHEYQLLKGDTMIAQITKKWIAWTDSYVIDVEPEQDDVLVLACAVVIDLACHEEKNNQ